MLIAISLASGANKPVGKSVESEFHAGIKRNGASQQFTAHKKYSAKLFDDSRGTKSFRDKTGNCRLPWVEQLVIEPIAAVERAGRFTHDMMVAARSRGRVTPVLDVAAVKFDVGETKLPGVKFTSSDVLERLQQVIQEADRAFGESLARLTDDEQTELRQHLYDQTTGQSNLGHHFADRKLGRRVTDLLEKIERRKLWESASALSAATDPSLLAGLRKLGSKNFPEVKPIKGVKGKLHARIETLCGTILVGGDGPNEFLLDELDDVCAVVDLGGNDIYIEGSTTAKRRVLVLIDLSGDDLYRGKKPGIQGAAVLGASVLVDLAGDDRYTLRDVAQGSALGGVGLLVDHSGKDHYRGDRRVQGQAVAGCGILTDRAGSDDYHAALLAQGVGGPIGLGLLADLDGQDHYYAGGKYPGGYDDSPGFGGWSQGVGVGPRGVANGGIGVLLDGGGDDIYEADYFSHGGGYWFAAGFARDFGGNDQRVGATRKNFDGTKRTEPRFVRWGTGYGCHFAAGFVIDDAGDDTYVATVAAVAFAWDIAVAAICDLSGDDRYITQGSGVAEAYNSGVAILYDRQGNDDYQGRLGQSTEETPYHPDGGSGNYTLLFDDGGGQDKYSLDISNTSDQTRGWAGARLIDR